MFCKIILPSSEIFKLPSVPKSYEDLHQTVLRKFKAKIPDKFYFKYKDCDEEYITLSSDEDLETAIVSSEFDKVKTLKIFLVPEGAPHNQNPKSCLPGLLPPAQESHSAENPNDRGFRGKQGGRESGVQGYGKRAGDGLEGIDEYDVDRPSGQFSGAGNRLKKSQSQNEDEEEVMYDKRGLHEGSSRHGGRELMGVPFNQEQLGVISEMLEKKLKEKVEQRVHIAVNDIMGKLSEEWRTKPVKKNPYTHNPLMSKSVVPGFSSRPTVRSERVQQDVNEYYCVSCRKKIDDVKYSCLDCANFDCCEACEEKVDHPHSLLKTRLNKKPKAVMDLPEASGAQNVPQPHEANFGKYGSLMMANKSQSNGFLKVEDGGAHGGNRLQNSTMPAAGLMRFSNSMASINMNEKAMVESHNPYQAKNPSYWGKGIGSINMSQSTFSSKNAATPTPGEREVKKYRAAIVKPPIYDLINVKPGHIYRVEFTIKNNGTEQWPENIKLICINGVHKGTEEALPALGSMDKFEVKLALKAPMEPNRYLSQWRLQYTEDGTPKPFGSNLFIEINVAEEQKRGEGDIKKPKADKIDKEEKVEKVERIDKEAADEAEKEPEDNDKKKKDKDAGGKGEKVGSPGSGVKPKLEVVEEEKPGSDVAEGKERVKILEEEPVIQVADKEEFTVEERRLMKEKKCSEAVLRHAQSLHAIYPDIDLERQIDFVAECPIHLDINDIVMVYSARVDQGFSMNY